MPLKSRAQAEGEVTGQHAAFSPRKPVIAFLFKNLTGLPVQVEAKLQGVSDVADGVSLGQTKAAKIQRDVKTSL